MPTLQPVDESFLSTAPTVASGTWSIAKPAQAVWDELVSDKPLSWCRGLNVAWKSARPFGVGTARQAQVLGLIAVQEHFFIWEEGRRYAFYVTSANLPLFSALAEDYVVEPRGENACQFTWTVAIKPSTLGKPGTPLNKVIFGSFFKDTGRHFNA